MTDTFKKMGAIKKILAEILSIFVSMKMKVFVNIIVEVSKVKYE